jgi:hypothetical protein
MRNRAAERGMVWTGDDYTAREIVRKIEEEREIKMKRWAGRKSKCGIWKGLATVLRGKTVHKYFS